MISNSNDLISIIVPIYNTEKYLRECLDSIKHQTYKNFEAILVDDGSTDASSEIVDEYCEADNRFVAIHQENGGQSAARNAGLDVAQGKYVVFWDSDDIAPEDSLENMHETIDAEEADFVVGGVMEFDIFKNTYPKGAKFLSQKKEIDRLDRNFNYSLAVHNKMYRREKIEEEGLRFNNTKYFEDGDFLWRLISRCNKIAGCNHIVYNLRIRPFYEAPSITQVGSSYMFSQLTGTIEMMRKTIEAIDGDEDKKASLLDTMYYRYAGFNLINLFYRVIWKSQKDFTNTLNLELGNAMRRMSEEKIQLLVDKNPDIDLAKPLRNRVELAKNPVFAIVITSDVGKDAINNMLANLYSQKFPAFIVFAPKEFEDVIDPVYKHRENFQFFFDNRIGRLSLKRHLATAKYLIYSDHEVYWDDVTLFEVYNIMNENPDWTLLKCKDKGKHSLLSNKIIRIEYAKNASFFFASPGRAIKKIPDENKGKCKSLVFTGSIEDLK